jgi:hypothetical protein
MLNFTMKKIFSEKWPLSLNRSKQDNINYIFELVVENTLKCNQIKNVHIGENGQGPLWLHILGPAPSKKNWLFLGKGKPESQKNIGTNRFLSSKEKQ